MILLGNINLRSSIPRFYSEYRLEDSYFFFTILLESIDLFVFTILLGSIDLRSRVL